eukprot:704564_1
MAQATKEELDTINNTKTTTNDNPNDNNNIIHTSALTEDELKNQAKELNELMDPSQLTTTQQHCIAQIIACFITNHIHRYYHCHRYVAAINNTLNNLNMTENKQDTNTDNNTNEQKQNEQKENEQKELHLIYPIPIIKPPPQSLFKDENTNTE